MYNQFYQPMYRPQMQPMPQMAPVPQIAPVQEETLYVPNEQAAESYLMAPNSFVRLWDANLPVFYEKRTDQQGRPFPMKKYSYQEAAEPVRDEPKDLARQFVTREEFEALRAKMEAEKGDK